MDYNFGDRLRQLLEEEDLSPSQFAEELQINRSAISHLVNNRNKPGYDFLTRVRSHYPHWDLDWLLFGMARKKKSTGVSAPTQPQPATSQHSEPTHEKRPQQEGPYSQQRPNDDYSPQNRIQNGGSKAYQTSLFDQPRENERKPSSGNVAVQKRVTRTILIYSDGTFEIFHNKMTE